MKCRKCPEQAVMNMRHHKLALCREHYIAWIRQQTERFITTYHMFTHDEPVLVAVSGGKDSLALWDILDALGYPSAGLYIDLGIDGGVSYSQQSRQMIQQFIAERPHLDLIVVDVAEAYGATIPQAAQLTRRGQEKPCSLCGLTRRHIMNRTAREAGYPVLATGHNLDDEAAALMSNTLTWRVDYLARQYPVLPAKNGLARKVKPLFRFHEREMAAYALLRGIDYVYTECPYAADASSLYYKEMLNRLEADRLCAKLQFVLNFLRAKDQHGAFARPDAPVTLHHCPNCGEPTGLPQGPCAFCRLWERVNARLIHSTQESESHAR